jgi:hypothetical protein
MKTGLVLLCLVGLAAAGRMQKCTASGDPHYQPFGTRGKKAKFTIMGEGEFTLAKTSDFEVTACSQDVSIDRTTASKLTWNRDFAVTETVNGVKYDVIVDGGAYTANQEAQYTIKVLKDDVPQALGDKYAFDGNLGLHSETVANGWNCDANRKKGTCRLIFKDSELSVRLTRAKRGGTWANKGHRFVIKFLNSHHLVTANIATKTAKTAKFGVRTLFNMMVKIPKTETVTGGLCGQSKTMMHTYKASKDFSYFVPATRKLTNCAAGSADDVKDTELAVTELIDAETCDAAAATTAVEACANALTEDILSCVMDGLEACGAADVLPLIDFEQDNVPYSCPANSYISSTAWPITDFDDCTCYWGYSKVDDEAAADAETCKPDFVTTGDTGISTRPNNHVCFCDGGSDRFCMQSSDHSCGYGIKTVGDETKPCYLREAGCVCSPGTYDCTGRSYTIEFKRQPALSTPQTPFGTQPIVTLKDQDGNIVTDSKTTIRISIANVQDDSCKCGGDKPCLHNNAADNTCFAKYTLFGDQVCPAGTTECLPAQTHTKLYQKIVGENPSDANSLEAKTTQCRLHTDQAYLDSRPEFRETLMNVAAGNGFCSGMTPCKHKGDGHCMQKTAFINHDKVPAPVETSTCKGTEDWRRAVPTPSQGWFFETDDSCSMTGELGCSDADHSYAMDKWCDHNCHPKYPGQPAFCPESHCDCTKTTAPQIEDDYDWKCPADRYSDGSCRCTPGTEYCGAIEQKLYQGNVEFDHLTIGTEGRYQLLAEIVMPDQLTGSNNIAVSAKSAVFDVMYPKTAGTTCRAQSQWRLPAMYDSEAHGEGKAWFYEDGKKCTSYQADGTCEAVSEVEYAMDKWCKANKCAEHTLVNHCEFYTPTTTDVRATCASSLYDMFGDCCESKHVDQCGVCNGDGSTCQVVSYAAVTVDYSQPEIVFDASLADSSCSLKTPCMHLNDGHCMPKTFNSPDLTGEAQHCFWDRDSTAAEQSHYKSGTWDVEGRMSGSILTHFEDGNGDCYCSAGTVDISKKLKIEEDAAEEAFQEIEKRIDEVGTPEEKKVVENSKNLDDSKNLRAYDSFGCKDDARYIELSTNYDNILCGTHFKNSGEHGSCWCGFKPTCGAANHPTCSNDLVRSIYLPPMTTAKLYKHCKGATAGGQARYPSLENFGTTAKCVDLTDLDGDGTGYQNLDVSMIQIEGAVLNVKANIVGTISTCYESQCATQVEKCQANADCKSTLEEAEYATAQGEDFSCAVKEMLDTTNAQLKDLYQCIKTVTACGIDAASSKLTELTPARQIYPTNTFTSVFADSSSSFFERRRLVAGAASGSAVVQISTSGNQGVMGATAAGATSSAQFAAGGAAGSGASTASSAGVGTAGAVGIAVGCTAIAALAIAFVIQQKSAAGPVSNANAGTTMAKAAEDHTDVL